MTHRSLAGKQSLLRIFIGDFDVYNHKPLYEYLLKQARDEQLAGCTVIRAHEGFGNSGTVHTGIELEGAGERPILVEFVDEEPRIKSFWAKIEPLLSGALATEEEVHVHHYQAQGTEDPRSTHKTPDRSKESANMTARELSGKNTLLRIYVGESDKIGHNPLHFELVERARKAGLAGATSIHGVAGFGANSVMHTPHAFRLSSDLPVVIEIVDEDDKVHAFLNSVSGLLQGALVTEEKVKVLHYSHKA